MRWNKCPGKFRWQRPHCLGQIFAEIFAAQQLNPDFEFQGFPLDLDWLCPSVAGESDIYLFPIQRRQFDSADCRSASVEIPELWHPQTGVIEPAPVWSAQMAHDVAAEFSGPPSRFVIFRHARTCRSCRLRHRQHDGRTCQRVESWNHARHLHRDDGSVKGCRCEISELVRDGQTTILENNEPSAVIPPRTRKKNWRVNICSTAAGEMKVHENETLALPIKASLGQPPQWEASVTAGGSPVVKAWMDGHVELRPATEKVLHAGVEKSCQWNWPENGT